MSSFSALSRRKSLRTREIKFGRHFWERTEKRLLSQKCSDSRGKTSPRSGRKSKAHGASRGNQLQALIQPAKRAKDASAERRFFGCGKGSLCGRTQSMLRLRTSHGHRTASASLFRPLRGLHPLNRLLPTAGAVGFRLSPASRARPHSGSRPRLPASSATHQLAFCAPLRKDADPGNNALVGFLGEGLNALKEKHF